MLSITCTIPIHSVPESDHAILVTEMKQVYSLVPNCAMWFLIYPFTGFTFFLVFAYNLVFKACLLGFPVPLQLLEFHNLRLCEGFAIRLHCVLLLSLYQRVNYFQLGYWVTASLKFRVFLGVHFSDPVNCLIT